MLTWLADIPHLPGFFHLFRYLTFRTLGAAGTGLFLVLFFGPVIITALRLKQGKGQPIRLDGPASHLLTKRGTPTMGGLIILFGLFISAILWDNLESPYGWVAVCADRVLRRLSESDEAVASRVFRSGAADGRVRNRRARLLRDDAPRRQRREFARRSLRQRLRVRSLLGVPALLP